MEIRMATSSDKESVLQLFDEFSLFFKNTDKPSEIGRDIFDEVISRKDTMIFLAEGEKKVVGFMTFYLLPNIRHGWHQGHIEDFFVLESYRGKGVGTELFHAVKTYCKNNNVKVIKLNSGNDLIQAHEFYEKNGGKTTERFFRFDLE